MSLSYLANVGGDFARPITSSGIHATMASLLTINDDVIREIGMNLLHEKSTLCALALTHRSLHKVIQKLVVRNVEVWVQGSYDVGIERYNQLVRTFESQADLGANTRSLRLKWGCDTRWHDTDKDAAEERANRLLSLTPNIRSLDIQNYSHKCSPFAPSLDLLLNLHLLKEITTLNPRSTVHEVTQLMQVPNLQNLVVQYMDVHMTPQAQSITDSETLFLATHLTQLTLVPFSHLHPSAVQFLLTIASSVKKLLLSVPGVPLQEAPMRGRRQSEIGMLESLSPAGVLTCLRPVRETLVEFDLNDVGLRWPGHDGSRMNLRAFTCMKKISLCAGCIFVPHGSWESRKGLGELLPKTVEEIVVSYVP